MKRRFLYEFRKGLRMTTFQHMRITYVVNENKRNLDAFIKNMEKEIEPNEVMKDFFKQREELAKKFSFKDEHGNPKLKKASFDNPNAFYDIEGENDTKSIYSLALAKLEKKFKEQKELHEEKVRVYNEEFLEDETDFTPKTVKLSIIEAHEKCPQNIMDLIYPMIKYN